MIKTKPVVVQEGSVLTKITIAEDEIRLKVNGKIPVPSLIAIAQHIDALGLDSRTIRGKVTRPESGGLSAKLVAGSTRKDCLGKYMFTEDGAPA